MSAAIEAGRFGSGQSVRRVEDPALVQGQGRFTDDVAPAGQVFLRFVRSTEAHARLVSVDTAAARALPGVLAVWTGADLAAAGVKPIARRAGVQAPRRAADGDAAEAARSRTRRCATSARRSRWWSPRRARRRAPRSTR